MSKSEVLKALLDSRFVNGTELSSRLGISRAAIWKSIQSLREDGYEISSKTNNGYSLDAVPDILSSELISASQREKTWNLLIYDSIDSTNNEAKRLADCGLPDRSALLCNEQTDGKGRLGRSFLSRGGLGLYLTAVLRPDSVAKDVSYVTAITAVAVRRAIVRVSEISPSIKWTNDLVVNGKKLCGILTELSVEGESGRIQYVAIGIGVNVDYQAEDFPEEIRAVSTSLAMEGKAVRRTALAAAILDELDLLYSNGRFTADLTTYRQEYAQHCITIGRDVSILRGTEVRHGKAVGLDDTFALLVDFGDGSPAAVQSGEVSVRGMYGYV